VCCGVLQCAAECCRVLHSVAVCCSALQRVAACCSMVRRGAAWCSVLQCACQNLQLSSSETVAKVLAYFLQPFPSALQGCRVLQGVAVCCSVLQGVRGCYSMLQYVARSWVIFCSPFYLCCSALQCVAVCCDVLQRVAVLVLEFLRSLL